MKRSPLKRSSSLSAAGKPKGSQPRRDWSAAREKVELEARCRFYGHDLGCAGTLAASHVIGREHDGYVVCRRCEGLWHFSGRCTSCRGTGFGKTRFVHPDAIIPLCRIHHDAYDAHRIDVLPVLTLDEQLQAVRDAGGIGLALRRISGRNYERAA